MDLEVKPDVIKWTDIDVRPPSVEGTGIVLQRHEEYQRDENSTALGSLNIDAFNRAKQQGANVLRSVFSQLGSEERNTVNILVVASDTQYKQRGMRAIETGRAVIEGMQNTLIAYGLSSEHILNFTNSFHGEGGPRPTENLREPNMFTKAPEFENFLKQHYGDGQEFWAAFEEDRHADVRQELGAEGPRELGDRLARFVDILARYAEMYHKKNPGRRLLIWADTHYDTISPYIKQHIALGREGYLPVEYGGGVSIDIQPDGAATTKIGDKQYDVSLHPHH